ncbi:hypothetical protein BpHYR1_016396 [Brachionus plicatilis]|uniref:Uncharacterized protein n=1 Tax=Brachionus plicatilis TaxID=10195 RepID=A0A3M7SWP6_BRAPC|nr:hypothetical protein BpHYR1_016396 [Brachionus plicatilis]
MTCLCLNERYKFDSITRFDILVTEPQKFTSGIVINKIKKFVRNLKIIQKTLMMDESICFSDIFLIGIQQKYMLIDNPSPGFKILNTEEEIYAKIAKKF